MTGLVNIDGSSRVSTHRDGKADEVKYDLVSKICVLKPTLYTVQFSTTEETSN